MKLMPAAAISLALLAPPVPAAAADGSYSATIRRTEYGIPHVTAKDYGGLGFGYGYAFAQDNLCTLASWMVTLRGERSRYFGPKAESDDPVRPVANLASDVYYKSVAESGVVRRLLARPAPVGPSDELRRLVDGYVAGYNRYLADTGVENLPDPTCRGKAWVGPITATDMWNNLLDLDRMVGSSQFKEAIAGVGEAEDEGPRPKPAAGSNAWALGRQATRGNGGMVLADPHFPWQGIRRFYQVQLTIPGVLDVSGGSLYGTPVVQIGHNARVAWTHTVSHAQRFTVYRLKLADDQSYLVDGRAEPMGEQEVEVTLPDGTVSGHTLRTSRYGPVLAVGRTDEAAYALADANAANLRAADEWLAMARAGSLDELRAAQRTHQGMPFVHTLATDASGTAYFADTSVVPHVTDAEAKRCAKPSPGPSPVPGLEAYVLDGSTSACMWGRDGDAVVPGVFGPGNQPRLIRADYVANSNNTYWMTNPAKPLTGYPKAYGETGTELEPRPRVSLDMIAQRLSGTDGLGAPGFTLETLQATVRGKRNLTFELMRDDLLKLCRTDSELRDAREACRTLGKWNGRATLDGEGAVLWREFFTRLGRPTKPGEPVFSPWRVPFDPARPLTTPSGLKTDDPAVRQALADAVLHFTSNRIPLTLTPGQAQSYASIPIPGCTEGEGCFDRVRTGGPLGTDGRYPEVNTGSSFMMAVALTPEGPRTRTVLTYSLSANPASPHHTDQTALFSHGGWVTERFTEAEIAADPHLETVTVRGGR